MSEQSVEILPPEETAVTWPEPWMANFLYSMSLIDDVASACRYAKVSRSTVYLHQGKNAEFAEAWKDAQVMAQGVVTRICHTWVTEGVPVRSVTRRTTRKLSASGEVLEINEVTVESESRERSARLMERWMEEAGVWSTTRRTEITGPFGGPVQLESIVELDRKIAVLAAEEQSQRELEPAPRES